jgi:digeranylgeranylglycerophospholipid reductase
MYDVAIVGAGPAGLMAAKTAAESGLKTVLIEKRDAVFPITRACCQQFIMDEGYEQETIRVEKDRIVFLNNNFTVPYAGPQFPVTEKRYISPGGHAIRFANEDGSPLAVQFDKGELNRGLLEQGILAGAEVMAGVTVYDAHDDGKKNVLSLTSKGVRSSLTAKKVIVADGANSRIAEALGMNADRTFHLATSCICYLLEDVIDSERHIMKSFMGGVYQSRAPIILYPYFDDVDHVRLFVAGTKERLPDEVFEYARSRGTLAPYLEKARVVKKTGCTLKVYSPMAAPHKGNAIVAGDAAAYVEVEVQGALMCGFHAARAVSVELEGKEGFKQYTDWWQKAFEFNSDAVLRVAQGYALVPTYSDDELDYIFGLVEQDKLPGSYSQYNTPKYMWDAIFAKKERIGKERPELLTKINNNMNISLSDVL